MKSSRLKLVLVAGALTAILSRGALAEDWLGGNGVWSATVPPAATIGWDTTIPNGVGAIAQKTDATSGTVTADFAGIVVGTISMGGANNAAFGVTPANSITLDQDGAGPGFVTISNTNTNGGTSPSVILNTSTTGNFILADDILISNTSNSTRTTGAVRMLGLLSGAGNMRIVNNSNAFPLSTGSYAGAVRFETSISTFVGNVGIEKGLVTYNNANSFGDNANVVTLGAAGQGDVTVVTTAATLDAHNYVVAAGTGGTTILGSLSTTTSTTAHGYTGTVTLNGNLTTTGASLIGTGPNFSGNISGAGGITHFGNALGLAGPQTLGNATLSGTNTYGGVTTINSGNLQFAKQVSLYNGNTADWNATNLVVNQNGVATFYVGGAGEFTATDVDTLKALGTATGGFKNGSGIGFNTSSGDFAYASNIGDTNAGANSIGLVKYGLNRLTLSGTNNYTGITVVAQGTLQFEKQVSFYNNTPADWTKLTVSAGTTTATVFNGTTAAFNVGGAGEFTASDIDTIKGLGTATSGFLGTDVAAATSSNLGFDTTNAGGTFVYGSNIANPNGGANMMGITKLGTGILELTGTNTYAGTTIIDGGTLRLNGGSHTINPVATVTNQTGNYLIGSVAGATGELIVDGADITSDNGIMVGLAGTGSMTLNSGTVTLKADNAGAEAFLGIGRLAGSTGTYVQNGGSLLVGATGNSDWFVVGRDGAGTATLNMGDIKASTFALAQGATGSGNFTINGGTVTTSANMYVVAGTASITQTGGDLKIGTWFTLGEGATAVATYNISGGTMSTGNVASENFVLGFGGQATVTQTGGDITVGNDWNAGWTATGVGTHTISAGTVTADQLFFGIDGIATLNQSGGTISMTNFSAFGRGAPGTGTYNMSGGTSNWGSDLNIGDFGIGILNHTGGTINAFAPILGWQASANGTATIDGATAVLNATGTSGLFVGLNGLGTFNLKNGSVTATNASGDIRVGNNASGNGTVLQTGGSIESSDQFYVALSGIGNYTLDNGTIKAGDNLWIGLSAGGVGTLTVNNGTVTVVGNDPTYTGNVVMARDGNATLNMAGGTLDMVVNTTTTNSLSHSLVTSAGPNFFDLAQDGNFMVGERTGVATANISGGLVKVAANVFVGSINVVDSAFAGTAQGTLNITGGEVRVGVTSATGGDLVIGGTGAGAAGTVNLQGGMLNVSNGSGKIGAGLGTVAFSFTGGTLKVKEYNAGDFGGSLGGLVQTGATSVLDVTGNDTQINGGYTLTDGTVLAARQVTVSGDVDLSSNGELQWQMTGLNSANPGQWFGQIALTGNLVLGGTSDLELDFSPLATNGPAGTHTYWDANHSWKVIDTTTNTGSTTFATLTNGTFANGTFSIVVGTGVDLGDIFLNYAAVGPAVPGDFDGDGDVDGADFVAWQTHFPTGTGAVYGDGDADFDGDVDGADFVVWQTNFPFPPGPGTSPVPEPTSLLLMALSVVGVMVFRRRTVRG